MVVLGEGGGSYERGTPVSEVKRLWCERLFLETHAMYWVRCYPETHRVNQFVREPLLDTILNTVFSGAVCLHTRVFV